MMEEVSLLKITGQKSRGWCIPISNNLGSYNQKFCFVFWYVKKECFALGITLLLASCFCTFSSVISEYGWTWLSFTQALKMQRQMRHLL